MAATAYARRVIPADQRASLCRPPLFDATLTLFGAKSCIFAQGDRAASVYYIEFGSVRVYRLLRDGRRQISAFHFAGETFGFETGDTHQFFAEAITSSGVRKLSLSHAISDTADLLSLVMHGLSQAQGQLLILSRQGACERIAAFLIEIAERQGGLEEFELPMSRADIGDYLGLTVETVSRVLSKLRKKEILLIPNIHTIRIVDWNALARLCELIFCEGAEKRGRARSARRTYIVALYHKISIYSDQERPASGASLQCVFVPLPGEA